MNLTLPPSMAAALQPLFTSLPPESAMDRLVPDAPASNLRVGLIETLVAHPAIAARLPLVAALWLYIDELDRSHKVSQSIDDPTGSFWHGIMHRREGDFSNSHHWFRKAGAHPAMANISDYDPHTLIDRVEAAHARGENPADLMDLQRREWVALFEWCAANSQDGG